MNEATLHAMECEFSEISLGDAIKIKDGGPRYALCVHAKPFYYDRMPVPLNLCRYQKDGRSVETYIGQCLRCGKVYYREED